MHDDTLLTQKLAAILPHLHEKQRRLLLAAEARALGHGGISHVARASGVSRATIHAALHEQEPSGSPLARVRQPGGGRQQACECDPTLVADLEALVDPDTRGDPMSPLRWTCKSTRQLAAALTPRGHHVSERIVRNRLHAAGYRLQAHAKTRDGRQHPDRDAQFRYLNEPMQAFLAQGLPVISVDTKKKALVGTFNNGGRAWQPQGHPEQVHGHDVPDPTVGKALPYGIDEVGHTMGWVTVGQEHDTARVAVASVRRWWAVVGGRVDPRADQVLIGADSGGSHGDRVRLWNVAGQPVANATGLHVTGCHVPPGTSQWNQIEHRLLAHISMHWRGRPLVSHEVMVELIGATTTRAGLHVQAELETALYPTKIKVSDEALAAVQLTPHTFHGAWNDTSTST